MNIKKLVSAVSALAVAGSVFTGLAVTSYAAAEPVDLSVSKAGSVQANTRHLNEDPYSETVKNNAQAQDAGTVQFNQAKNYWPGIAIVEFAVPTANIDMLGSATIDYTVHNTATDRNRTYSVYGVTNTGINLDELSMDMIFNADDLEKAQTTATQMRVNAGIVDNPLYNSASVSSNSDDVQTGQAMDGKLASFIKTKLKDQVSDTVNVQLAFSNSDSGFDLTLSTVKLHLTYVDTYSVKVKTAPYAKLTPATGGAEAIYSDYKGEAVVSGLPNTKETYTITKGGYNSGTTGEITFVEDMSDISVPLTINGDDVLFFEDFNTTGLKDKGLLYGSQSGEAEFHLNGNALEVYSQGNGTRDASIAFGEPITTDGSYKMTFKLSGIYMRDNKNGSFTNTISFVDNTDATIFSLVPTFTDNKVSTGIKVNDTVVTENDMAGDHTVEVTVADGTVKVKIDSYDEVTVTTTANGTIKGIKQHNDKLICAKIDDLKVVDYTAPVVVEPEKHDEAFTFDKTAAELGASATITVVFQNDKTQATGGTLTDTLGIVFEGQGSASIAVVIKNIKEGYSVKSVTIE